MYIQIRKNELFNINTTMLNVNRFYVSYCVYKLLKPRTKKPQEASYLDNNIFQTASSVLKFQTRPPDLSLSSSQFPGNHSFLVTHGRYF